MNRLAYEIYGSISRLGKVGRGIEKQHIDTVSGFGPPSVTVKQSFEPETEVKRQSFCLLLLLVAVERVWYLRL